MNICNSNNFILMKHCTSNTMSDPVLDLDGVIFLNQAIFKKYQSEFSHEKCTVQWKLLCLV